MPSSSSSDWSFRNSYFLSLMTLGYVVGELAHFMINTTSRAVARDVHYGDQACYENAQGVGEEANASASACLDFKTNETCLAESHCQWDYSGLGLQYQLLAGPSFIALFTVSSVILGVSADNLTGLVGRNLIMAAGVLLFSVCFLLMGMSNAYWQLVLLRMGIAAGEAVCRPLSGSLIAELFSPTSRALATGIVSWGVYYGYGLAFVIGIYLTQADVLGYSWRASYVLSALPGIVIAVLLAVTVRDPKTSEESTSEEGLAQSGEEPNTSKDSDEDDAPGYDHAHVEESYWRKLVRSFCSAPMLLLLLAAAVRHTSGYAWAYNTRLYFQTYYPKFDLGLWLFGCSVGGGSFGVFFGGYLSDRLVKRFGLHSRLWILSACTLLSTPFAVGVLYLEPPYALFSLIGYYFTAETWFAILFTVIIEVAAPEVRSTCIALFLFIMNNIGGNLPVLVDPLGKAVGYREALYMVWPAMVALSGVLFFVASLPLWRRSRQQQADGEE